MYILYLYTCTPVYIHIIYCVLLQCQYNISKVNIKDVMLTNPCFCVFGDVFHVLHFYCTHFQAIFLFNKIFINNFFNTIFKLAGRFILLLKTT